MCRGTFTSHKSKAGMTLVVIYRPVSKCSSVLAHARPFQPLSSPGGYSSLHAMLQTFHGPYTRWWRKALSWVRGSVRGAPVTSGALAIILKILFSIPDLNVNFKKSAEWKWFNVCV